MMSIQRIEHAGHIGEETPVDRLKTAIKSNTMINRRTFHVAIVGVICSSLALILVIYAIIIHLIQSHGFGL
jgi:hypothetical protein